jgi:hypothetical protein
MGVRLAWEAFRHFETLERHVEPVAAFLQEWDVAGDKLAAAAPDCRYPDLLLAFKLLLAYRPDQSGKKEKKIIVVFLPRSFQS